MKMKHAYMMVFFLIGLVSCSEKEDPIIDNEGLLPKPTAEFSVEVVDPKDPFTLKFINNSKNYAVTQWSFDDDSTSSDPSPTHTFLYTGAFNVKLVTLNEEGYWAQREETVRILPEDLIQLVATPTAEGLRMSYQTDVDIAETFWFTEGEEGELNLESDESDMLLDIPEGEFKKAHVGLQTPKGSVVMLDMLLADLGIVQDLTDLDKEFTVSHENSSGKDAGEGSSKLIDNNITTKWYSGGVNDDYFYWQFDYVEPQVINGYSMTSGNDSDSRDPTAWEVLGSMDGEDDTWEVLDTRSEEVFEERRQTRIFSFDNTKAYHFYRIHIISRKSSGSFQMSEFRMLKLPR